MSLATISMIAVATNAAARAMRLGSMNDMEKEIRRSFGHANISDEAVAELIALAGSYYAFGESVRIAVKEDRIPMSFGRYDD